MGTNVDGTVQSQGLPPIEDADLKPQAAETPAPDEKSGDSKADTSQAKSQPEPSKEGEAKEKGPGPWDAELAKRGLHEDPRFDSFLREVVQPYVTQLEQGANGATDQLFGGDQEAAEAMASLLSDLREDPIQAYRDLGEALGLADEMELPGEPVGDEEGLEDGEFSEGEEGGHPAEDLFAVERDYVRNLMEKEQEKHEDEKLQALLTAVGERVPGLDEGLFIRMLIAAGGNKDVALQDYMQYHRPPEPVEEAPPTLEGGGTPPPEAKKYTSIDDALEGFLSEERARRTK